MRVASRLFIRPKTQALTEFALVYSDLSATCGSICPAEDTDGTNLDEIRIFGGIVVNGKCVQSADGLRLFSDGGGEIVLPPPGSVSTPLQQEVIGEIRDRLVVEEFSRRFCQLSPPTAQHDYEALVHQDPALANNFLVSWFLGNTCNYSCSYCPTWLHDGTKPWQNYDVVKNFCDLLISQVPADKKVILEFNGGEVTLWKDYAKLCRHLKSKGVMVSMITNGTRPLAWWEENWNNFDIVQISYHTEGVRREHFLALCDFLKDRLDVRVYMMCPPGRLEECIEVSTIIAKKGISIAIKPVTENLLGEIVCGYSDDDLVRINAFNTIAPTLRGSTASRSESLVIRNDMVKQRANGKSQVTHVVEVISNHENTWCGWKCFSGPEQIVIDSEGFVYRGWCKVGGSFGHVTDPNFRLVSEPILCNKELCNCNFDMFSTKLSVPDQA